MRCSRAVLFVEGYLLPGKGRDSSPALAVCEVLAVDRVRMVSRQSAIAPTIVTAMGM